jgi:hypothetical protein
MGIVQVPTPQSGRAYTTTEITATGTFTVPTTMDGYVDILCVGGGGGGGRNNSTSVNNTGAGGGGGGGFTYYNRVAIPAGKVLTITIGAGGTGKTGTTGSGGNGNYTRVSYSPITGVTNQLQSVQNAGGPPNGTSDDLYMTSPNFQGYRNKSTVTYGSYGKGSMYSYWDNKGSMSWFTTASRSDVGSANPATSSPEFPGNFLGQGATEYFSASTGQSQSWLPPLISIARATNYGSNGTAGDVGTAGTASNFGAGIGLSGGGGSSGPWTGGAGINGAGGGGGGSSTSTAAGNGGNASANSGGGGGGGACSSSSGAAGTGGNGGSGLVVIGYWA